MRAKKSISMKAVVLLLAVVLLIGCTIGGTLAWLQDTTGTVTNTFTAGDVDIELAEVDAVQDGNNYTNDNYKILPGTNQTKEATVTVKDGSEDCWVFVKITESDNYIKNEEGNYTSDTYIVWNADNGKWTFLSKTPESASDTVTYVYYIEQAATTQDETYHILTDDKISYSSNLTKEQLEALGTTKPTLTFQAYAIQSEGLKDSSGKTVDDAAAAWSLIGTTN